MSWYPKNLKEYINLAGVPRGYKSQILIVDPVNGDDDNNGRTFDNPLASVEAAEDLLVAERQDTVLLLPGDTADNPTGTIAWDKDYTNLIGLYSPVPGFGQRCRIVGTAATAIGVASVFNFSARGCLVKGVEISNETAAASGAAIVSGPWNYFENCYFSGMQNTSSGNKTTSFSLTVTGAENYFRNCAIGTVHYIRAAVNSQLIITNGQNNFENCKIQSQCATATAFMVDIEPTVGGLGLLHFKDCTFWNMSVNYGTHITDCFHLKTVGEGAGHHLVFLDNCTIIGEITEWANVHDDRIVRNMAAPAATGGVSLAISA